MARNIFLPGWSLKGERIHIEGEQLHYLKNVVRVQRGDELSAIIGDRRYELRVSVLQEGRIICNITGARNIMRERRISILVYLGLLKSKKMDFAVAKLSELGVKAMCPLKTARTVPGGCPGEEKIKRWEKIALEGAKVSGAETVMKILPVRTIAAAVEELRDTEGEYKIVFSLPSADRDLGGRNAPSNAVPGNNAASGDALIPDTQGIPIRKALDDIGFHEGMVLHLFFGPEGGYSPEEFHALTGAGVVPASMGEHVLKSETAAIVGAGFIRLYYAGL